AFNNRTSSAILDADRLDDLLLELGCNLRRFPGGSRYSGPCPIHGGDGKNFRLGTGGDVLPIWWACHSRECHREYKPSLLGFVRGVLSFQEGKKVSIQTAMNFIKRFVAKLPTGANPRPRPAPKSVAEPFSLSREQVRARLVIPSPYFVTRGFNPSV